MSILHIAVSGYGTEGQSMHLQKHCAFNNEDEDNSLNIQSDNNYQTSSLKFRHISFFSWFYEIYFKKSF